MDHERLRDPARDLDLRLEGVALIGRLAAVAVEVEPGLADGGAARVPGEALDLGRGLVVEAAGAVRVAPDARPHRVEALRRARSRSRDPASSTPTVSIRVTPAAAAAATSSSSGGSQMLR